MPKALNPASELTSLFQAPNTLGKDIISSASKNINDLTRKRISDLLSQLATSGLSRSGIGGVAVNDILSNANDALTNASVQGNLADRNYKLQILSKLLGFQAQQDSNPGFFDFLGGLVGNAGGTLAGTKLAKVL